MAKQMTQEQERAKLNRLYDVIGIDAALKYNRIFTEYAEVKYLAMWIGRAKQEYDEGSDVFKLIRDSYIDNHKLLLLGVRDHKLGTNSVPAEWKRGLGQSYTEELIKQKQEDGRQR